MKEELRKKLKPYFEQLEEVENDLNRITQAQVDCIKGKRINGCWNCETKEEWCTVSQTRLMVQARRKNIHLNIVNRVKEWLDDV